MSLAAAVLATAARHPERPALVVDGGTHTYAELLDRASAVARAIERSDADAAPLVGVFGERTFWVYAGVLGALLAGRGYVPLNPGFPAARTQAMMERSAASVVIVAGAETTAAGAVLSEIRRPLTVIVPEVSRAPAWAAGTRHRVLCAGELARDPVLAEPLDVDPEAIAYLLFTSGTTGVPKGIGIRQSNVGAYLEAAAARYAIGPEDRCSQNFALTFDLSVHDMFVCWTGGGCLCVPPARAVMAPGAFVHEQRLTSWFSTPSTAAVMQRLRMLRPNAFPTLRWSLFCGEALAVSVADAWREAAPASELDNLYGPTEATIACTVHRYPARATHSEPATGVVPIGHPFGRTRVAVVSDGLRPVAEGEAGELVLGGDQVAPGYWKDDERTAAAFVPIPALHGEGPWYRTGDLVSLDADVGLIYRGRLDDQIKIRGHRVELQEIESALRRASGATSVVALGWPRTPAGADGVIAFIVGGDGDAPGILEGCRRLLPDYMIPSEVHRLETMPLNASGKADRRRLLEMREQTG